MAFSGNPLSFAYVKKAGNHSADCDLGNGETLYSLLTCFVLGISIRTKRRRFVTGWIFEELLRDRHIAVPTYSPVFLRYFQKYDFVFTPDSDSVSGGLARAYIRHTKRL